MTVAALVSKRTGPSHNPRITDALGVIGIKAIHGHQSLKNGVARQHREGPGRMREPARERVASAGAPHPRHAKGGALALPSLLLLRRQLRGDVAGRLLLLLLLRHGSVMIALGSPGRDLES